MSSVGANEAGGATGWLGGAVGRGDGGRATVEDGGMRVLVGGAGVRVGGTRVAVAGMRVVVRVAALVGAVVAEGGTLGLGNEVLDTAAVGDSGWTAAVGELVATVMTTWVGGAVGNAVGVGWAQAASNTPSGKIKSAQRALALDDKAFMGGLYMDKGKGKVRPTGQVDPTLHYVLTVDFSCPILASCPR